MLPIPVPLIVWFGILGVVVLAAVVTLARSPRKSRKKSKRSSPSVPLKSTYLEAVNGRKGHTATVIFLHGMGQSSQEWKEYAETLNASMPHVRFIFPQAPTIPITILGGERQPAWFNIRAIRVPPQPGDEDEAGVLSSARRIHQIVENEIKGGIDERRIVVAGFSQGGAMCYIVAITTTRKLAGFVSLSSWLPLFHKAEELQKPGTYSTPFFHGHGVSDPIVKFEWGKRSALKLQYGLMFMSHVIFKEYLGLGHTVNAEETLDIGQFLMRIIPPLGNETV